MRTKTPSPGSLAMLDYECVKCMVVEERLVRHSERTKQACQKCGSSMMMKFPLGKQLDYMTDPIKPFLDHVSPAVQDLGEAWITTKSQWRERVKYSERMGFKQGYKGGGHSVSRKTLEEAEERYKVK